MIFFRSYSSFSDFLKVIEAHCRRNTNLQLPHVYISCAPFSPSCIPISSKIFFTLSIHPCFGLPSGLFPTGFRFNIAFITLYLTSMYGQPMRFFRIVILQPSGSLHNCSSNYVLLLIYNNNNNNMHASPHNVRVIYPFRFVYTYK